MWIFRHIKQPKRPNQQKLYLASDAAETAISECSGRRLFRGTAGSPGEPRGAGWREEQKTGWIYDPLPQNGRYQWVLQGDFAVWAAVRKLCSLTDGFVSQLHVVWWCAAALCCPFPLSGNTPHSCQPHLQVLVPFELQILRISPSV